MPIQRIHCNPPIGIARVGGSSVPLDAFCWSGDGDPRVIGETQLKPEWTLDVESDGSITPRMPTSIILKDGGLIRPVAPFIELWCDVGNDDDSDSWERVPLTKSLLAEQGLNAANIIFTATAMNRKVARRTGNPNHRYGTAQPVRVRGGEHQPSQLLATSFVSQGVAPMIPFGRSVPLGSIQMIRPGDQPLSDAQVRWTERVNIETIRLRITPAKGRFYGPPGTAEPILPTTRSRGFSAVTTGNDFLDAGAGWAGAAVERINVIVGQPPQGLVSPGDTYDGAELSGANDASLGIIDDTCDIQINVTLEQSPVGRASLHARANVFCGPPDYSPDRRPFLSLADSIADRGGDSEERNRAISNEDLDRWVEDLFERAYETVSLLNVDFWRRLRGADIPADKRRNAVIVDDQTIDPGRALGGLDRLRNADIAIAAATPNTPLPITERAKERHRNLSDIASLKRFVRENPDRLNQLVRKPFFSGSEESASRTTMEMPPFMRNSNAQPLTLAVWQYELLMEWQRRVVVGSMEDVDSPSTRAASVAVPIATMSPAAADRQVRVLERLRTNIGVEF